MDCNPSVGEAGDWLDGFANRRLNGSTRFGAILDNEFDSVATLLGALLGVVYGQLPVWYLLAAACHNLFFGGIWLRKRQGRPR